MRKVIGGLAVILALAGCGSAAAAGHPFRTHQGHAAASAVAKAIPAPAPGPAAFVAAVQAAGLGNKDLAGNRAEKLVLRIGADTCNLIGDQGYADTVAFIARSLGSITVMQAQTVVNSAIVNLCPDHSGDIPGGSNG